MALPSFLPNSPTFTYLELSGQRETVCSMGTVRSTSIPTFNVWQYGVEISGVKGG